MATPATSPDLGHIPRAVSDVDRPAADQASPPPDVLDALSRTLLGGDGLDRSAGHTLRIVVAAVLGELPQVSGAGVTLVQRDGTVASRAPSDVSVTTVDALQSSLGEGPRHDCLRLARPVVGDDLAATGPDRWPRFAPAALGHHVRALCAVPLLGRDARIAGTLNLYASAPGAFSSREVRVASLIASYAALALHAAHRVAGLSEALASRDVIGQAKGVLTERHGLSEQQAFELLVASSQETNMKLRDVATWLVDDTQGRDGVTSAASMSAEPMGRPHTQGRQR